MAVKELFIELWLAPVQEFSVMSYTLLLSLIEYKTLVLRKDYAAANEILPQIPQARLLLPALLLRASMSPIALIFVSSDTL